MKTKLTKPDKDESAIENNNDAPRNKVRAKKIPKETNLGKSSASRLQEIISIFYKRDIIRGITPEKLRLILEDLGPTFVKLGQIMSMRADILPAKYCEELIRLRADVRPVEFEKIKEIIEEEYKAPIDEVFESVEKDPLGSASIAQVHAATRRDGSRVVLKVQRPLVRETMERDIRLMRKASNLLRIVANTGGAIDFNMIIDELWAVTQQEMNFLIEAQHMQRFANLNEGIAYIGWPVVDWELTTSKILVMEYIGGIDIDRVDELALLGYDMNEIGEKLTENFIKQVVDDGFFHADPHPGNIRICEGRIVWIDFGMMGHLSPRDMTLIKNAIAAIAQNDVYALKTILLSLGRYSDKINHAALYTDIDDMLLQYGTQELADFDLGGMLAEILELANRHNISMPAGVTMLVRGMMTLEGVVAKCCPDVNIIQIMAMHMSSGAIREQDLTKNTMLAAKQLKSALEKTFDIPAQFSDVLKMTSKGQTKFNLELIGSEEPLRNIDRMVNKLILCVIDAALLISSSLVCMTQMKPMLLGIPLIGAIGYFMSFIIGIALLIRIFRSRLFKRRRRKKPKN